MIFFQHPAFLVWLNPLSVNLSLCETWKEAEIEMVTCCTAEGSEFMLTVIFLMNVSRNISVETTEKCNIVGIM